MAFRKAIAGRRGADALRVAARATICAGCSGAAARARAVRRGGGAGRQQSGEMRSGTKWVVILGVLLFIGYVVYGSVSRAQSRCEVCLEFNGEQVCRRGAGPTREEAQQAAQESACGGNARGMSEVIACRNAVPVSVQCSEG